MTEATEISQRLRLQEPFAPDDLEWRVQQNGVSNSGKPWVIVTAYVTNRAIQQRLDDVVGCDGWANEFQQSPDGCGVICGLSICFGVDWVTKWDGAEKKPNNSNLDETKSVLSNAMKRAAVQFGIGRYLYDLEACFAACHAVGSRRDIVHNHSYHKKTDTHIEWVTPELPTWALPNIEADEFVERINNASTIASLKQAFKEAYLFAKTQARVDLKEVFKKAYEAQKDRLDKQAQLNVKIAEAEIMKWLNRQIEALNSIPDASSVTRVCQTIAEQITADSEGQYYDTAPLFGILKEAEKNRIASIQESSNE